MKVNISKMTQAGRQYWSNIRKGIDDLYLADSSNPITSSDDNEILDGVAKIIDNTQRIQALAHWAILNKKEVVVSWLEKEHLVILSKGEKRILHTIPTQQLITPTTEQCNQEIAAALFVNFNLEELTKAVITEKDHAVYVDYAALAALESSLQKVAEETFVKNETYVNWLTIRAQIALMLSEGKEFKQILDKLREAAKSEDIKLKAIAAYNSFMLNCAYAQALLKIKQDAEAGSQKQAILKSYEAVKNNLDSMPRLKDRLSKAKYQLEENVKFNFLPVYFRHSQNKKPYFIRWPLILLSCLAITFLLLTLAAAIASAGLTVPVLTGIGLFLCSSLGSFTVPLIIGSILSGLTLLGSYEEYKRPGYLVSLCKRTINADSTATTQARALEGIEYSKELSSNLNLPVDTNIISDTENRDSNKDYAFSSFIPDRGKLDKQQDEEDENFSIPVRYGYSNIEKTD